MREFLSKEMEEKIDNPRGEIDAIDDELLRLLNRRVEIALKVGAVKRRDDVSLCDPRREDAVLERLRRQNSGPLSEQNVANIFQRVMDECLHAQQQAFSLSAEDAGKTEFNPTGLTGKPRAAFLGARGSFSEEAAIGLLGETSEFVPRPTIEELFASITEEKADYILVPIENSLVGSVHRNYDLLLASSLSIVAEIICPIAHFLIGCPGASLDSIETIESHPVALAQCERFFAAHPQLKREAANDTASGVRRVVEENNPARAAIGGRRAAKIYGGTILQEHLEDNGENFTRFVLLASKPEDSKKGEKISLVVRLAHRPGALHDALRPFVRRGIDLLKIESRPIMGSPWQYNFYLDLQAPASESELRGAMDEIREQAEELRYLGRYSSTNISSNK